MKLLFNQKLSPKLVDGPADLFPGSFRVRSIGLQCATDDEVWAYARHNDFAIVSKDEDFNYLSVLRGAPPKIIWVQMGNCTTAQVEMAFRDHIAEIHAFEKDTSIGTLVLK